MIFSAMLVARLAVCGVDFGQGDVLGGLDFLGGVLLGLLGLLLGLHADAGGDLFGIDGGLVENRRGLSARHRRAGRHTAGVFPRP